VLATNVNAKLNPAYVAGQSVTAFGLLPNSLGVLYLANQTTNTVVELYETMFFGGITGVTVNDILILGGNVLDFAISPDSTRVVYRANQDHVGVNELYQVVLSSLTNSSKLNGPLATTGDVSSLYVVTPDSASVVYVADQTVAGQL